MSLDELRTILREVAPWWTNGWVGFLALLGVGVVSGLGAFVGQYLGERGKNWATKHDFKDLLAQMRATTEATESIRNELSGQLWAEQERWKFKAELYRALIENLSEAGVAWDGACDVLKAKDITVASAEAFGKAVHASDVLHAPAVRRAAAVARVFLNPPAIAALNAFNTAMDQSAKTPTSAAPARAETLASLDRISVIIRTARDALIENAREDLKLDIPRR